MTFLALAGSCAHSASKRHWRMERAISMKYAARSHQGKVRISNQDAFLAREGVSSLFAVADGMGGHRGGNVASAMAIASLNELNLDLQPDEAAFHKAVNLANSTIWERQFNDVSLSGMGTTLTALWEGSDSLLLAHVGDSRAYCLEDGKLTQVTTDHSLVGELLRSGAINQEMARNYPYRNIVTRAVGTDGSLITDFIWHPKRLGSRWLLCTDGLTEYADTAQIAHLMGLGLDEGADSLMSLAMDGGARDNITLILMEVSR